MKAAELMHRLNTCSPAEIGAVGSGLYELWNELSIGNESGGMTADKLLGRMEDVRWRAPELTFVIERHGGTVKGSSNAELQLWTVNLETRTASYTSAGSRRVKPTNEPLSIKSIASEVVRAIMDGLEDPGILRRDDGTVELRTGVVFPSDKASKQTIEGRRKKLRDYVEQELTKRGWTMVKTNRYRPPSTSES